ncbi:MAG: alanine racemase [Victivallales bacterium]|nr:alanine racemase [Victivallales bacterium]
MFPTEVVVDYNVLRENFRALQTLDPGCHLAPVVKSDAYGHGIVESSRAFLAGGAEIISVFRVEEALELRDAGIDAPIWVLLGALPDEAASAVGHGFTLACFDIAQMRALSDAAVAYGAVQDIHIAVDTGMGRLGFRPDTLPEVLATNLPGLRLRGIFAHFAKACEPSHPVTMNQIARFRQVVSLLPPECTENHSCASDAWLGKLVPELKYARPGICLYADYPFNGMKSVTRDAMTVRTRLISVKEIPAGESISYNCLHTLERNSRVAVAPIGYEDGLMRSMSNTGYALVRGRRAPILGTICMSMTMLDVTDIDDACIGDEAVFLGTQGNERISVLDISERAKTTPHELLCNFGKHRS